MATTTKRVNGITTLLDPDLAETAGGTPGVAAANQALVLGAAGEIATIASATITALTTSGITGTGVLARAGLTAEAAVAYPILLEQCRVHDALQTLIPGTAAADDLGVIGGTYLTNAPVLQTSDLKAAGATSMYARFRFQVPPEYTAAGNITCRINAGMVTTVADNTATLDVECVRVAAPTADICATAAQSINSLTAANKDFTLTGTSIVVGDILDVRVTVAVNDAATVTSVLGQINSISLLLGIKG